MTEIMTCWTWVEYEYEMSMKIEDPKQEWKKGPIATLRAKTRTKTKTMSIGNKHRQ